MSMPINPELTGPGFCKSCGDWADYRPAKGLCRPCYDQQRRTTDPLAGLQQKAIDKAPAKLVRIQALIKELRDDVMVTPLEYVTVHRMCEIAHARVRAMTASDLRQQEDAAMDELELESRRMQPQPEEGEPDLQNIQRNPNSVEVEEVAGQPQPDRNNWGGGENGRPQE